jgi:hypothetical protein
MLDNNPLKSKDLFSFEVINKWIFPEKTVNSNATKGNKMKKTIPTTPGRPESEERRPVDVNELIESLVRANRERRQKNPSARRRGRKKVQSVVDRLISGDE